MTPAFVAVAVAGGGSPGSGLIQAENFLAQALRGVFALAEDYPDLKASDRFAGLQTELAQIEDDLQHARRYYNAVVRDLNTAVARFPDLLVAHMFGFERRDFFELDSPLERAASTIDLDS